MILSARGEPFKQRWRAEDAIKGMPGYQVVEHEGGFAGIGKEDETSSHPIAIAAYQNGVIALKKKDRKAKVVVAADVICPGCGQSYHETTPAYDPDQPANPAMLDLKEPWKGWGWDDLGKEPSMGYGCLVCPDCGSALAPSGNLKLSQRES
jgi:hypothetical protein